MRQNKSMNTDWRLWTRSKSWPVYTWQRGRTEEWLGPADDIIKTISAGVMLALPDYSDAELHWLECRSPSKVALWSNTQSAKT